MSFLLRRVNLSVAHSPWCTEMTTKDMEEQKNPVDPAYGGMATGSQMKAAAGGIAVRRKAVLAVQARPHKASDALR